MSDADPFRRQLAADRHTERGLAWRELIVIALIVVVVIARLQFGS